jgi:DNA repair protein RecO (recombination protein O)
MMPRLGAEPLLRSRSRIAHSGVSRARRFDDPIPNAARGLAGNAAGAADQQDVALKVQRDEAYVLRTQALGEADLIVSLLTRQHGKVRGVARSARRSRRRFGGMLEPLTRVRASWTEKEGRELHRIDALEGVHSYAPMQSDPVRQAACAVLSEVTDLFAYEGQAEGDAFRLLGAVLDCLEREAEPFPLVRYFEFWTLRLHGLLPDANLCAICGRGIGPRDTAWIGAAGGIHCRACHGQQSGGRRLGTADRAFLETLRVHPPAELPAAARAARPGGATATLLRRTLECFAERRLRTYRHLEAAVAASRTGESPT